MDRPNIILIVADTMRRDAIGIYNKNVSTPNIDALARDSMVYNNAISPSSWTVPSHASIFTGKYAIEHGLHETFDKKGFDLMGKMNDVKYETIAEVLLKSHYNTYGISANPNLIPGSGFDRGFNLFTYCPVNYYYDLLKKELKNIEFKESKIKAMVDYFSANGLKNSIDLIKLYKLQKYNSFSIPKRVKSPYNKGGFNIVNNIANISIGTPFFLFINFMEMHDPYISINNSHEPNSVENLVFLKKNRLKVLNKISKKYYQQANFLDTYIGNVIEFLKQNEIYDKTYIIFTSDHGQSITEDFYGHGTLLTDDLIKVPLIVKGIANEKREINDVISTINIFDMIVKITKNEAFINNNPIAFSESFGIMYDNALKYPKRKETSRIAIFKDGYKLSIDGNLNVEEFKYLNNNLDLEKNLNIQTCLMEDIYMHLGNELNNFLHIS